MITDKDTNKVFLALKLGKQHLSVLEHQILPL